MNAIPKKKLCWNCEGSVLLSQEDCPYCGVTTQIPSLEGGEKGYPPPYLVSSREEDSPIPASPYSAWVEPSRNPPPKEEVLENVSVDSTALKDFKKFLLSMFLMLAGSVFFLFGIVLGLFSSENGLFTLSWSGDNWYLYLLCSLPFLIFGWRTLQNLEDS